MTIIKIIQEDQIINKMINTRKKIIPIINHIKKNQIQDKINKINKINNINKIIKIIKVIIIVGIIKDLSRINKFMKK
jgi:hypothetical protein